MNDQVHSAIENVGAKPKKAKPAAPAAPTSAPVAPARNGSGRKTAAPKAAPAPSPPASTPAAPKVRKGPAPLMFNRKQTFACAIDDARTNLAMAKDAYKATKVALDAAEKARKQAFGEHHAAYKLLGAAIGDTPLHSDGNKAEISAAQETVKFSKTAHAEKDKASGVAAKAADKAEAAVKKAQEELNKRVDTKKAAATAAKGT